MVMMTMTLAEEMVMTMIVFEATMSAFREIMIAFKETMIVFIEATIVFRRILMPLTAYFI